MYSSRRVYHILENKGQAWRGVYISYYLIVRARYCAKGKQLTWGRNVVSHAVVVVNYETTWLTQRDPACSNLKQHIYCSGPNNSGLSYNLYFYIRRIGRNLLFCQVFKFKTFNFIVIFVFTDTFLLLAISPNAQSVNRDHVTAERT